MSLRATTVRRLALLLAAVLVMVGIAAALYWRNEYRKSIRLAEARAGGIAAFEAGDYRAALDSLKYYVARHKGKQDPEALYAYGVSRARLEEPNGRHIVEGITVFNALLQLDPDHLKAKHRLLELYNQAHYSREAVELADRVLAGQPTDAEALRMKVIAHDRLREYDKALAASQRLNELHPEDLDQQLITYELMRKLNQPPEALVERARQQQQAHPDDPRFAMLLAMALGHAGDAEQGKQWLTRAATQPAPDATYVKHMVRVFDTLKMYDQSQALLDRAIAQNPDPLVMGVLAQRLWQNGQNAQVIELLADLDPAAETSDTELLAYRALALFDGGQRDAASAIVAALAGRKADNAAIAWSTALAARFAGGEPKQQLERYQAALVRAPKNAVIHFLIGEARARMGETELAIAAWRRAAESAPSWATPHIDIARTLAASGRTREALAEAHAAARAAPTQIAAAVTLAGIEHKVIEETGGDAAEEARLLNRIQRIQQALPGEPETLPLYANLLAKSGRRDEAIAAIRSVTTRSRRRPDQATLLRLTAVSRAHHLGLEEELKQLAEQYAGDTPRLALARAADLAATGKPGEGLALLEEKARSATTRPAEWQLAITQFKELVRDPAARAEWVRLGDAHPKDLTIQTAILKTALSARADREFTARTIERVKQLTGPDGQTWRLERARWLLGGDGGKEMAEAVNMLTEIVRTSPTLAEARLLLASAFEQVNNIAGAIQELQAAAELEPANAAVAIEVARLMQSLNQFADARTYLERAAATPDLPADARRRIATMLAAQRDYTRAVKVLTDAGAALDPAGQVLLADIYRREGKLTDAEKIYAQLLEQQPLQLDTIRGAADFYAAIGRLDQAKKVLDRLGEVAAARPGRAELVRASFAERHISPEAAQPLLLAATRAAPRDPATWRHLLAYYLRSGRYDDAFAAARDALQATGGGKQDEDAVLQRLQVAARSLAQMSSQKPALRPMLSILATAAPEDRGASEFLALPPSTANGSARGAATQPSDESILARLRSIASLYPRSLPLQRALVQWHLTRGELADAAQVATRMMEAFASDPLAARIAAGVYRAAGQFDLAAATITRWRERAPEHALEADAILAEIRLAQGDAAAALAVMQPHESSLRRDPEEHRAALAALARAAVLAGHADRARQLLEPMLPTSRAARLIWLQLAGADIRDASTAADWVRHLAPMIPTDALIERTALGRAWYLLSTRPGETRAEGAEREALAVLDPIVPRDDAPGEAILLRAALADRADDVRSAEALYRRGLHLAPDHPEALNNLAYLLLLRGGDLSEAKQLAARAVEIAPQSANFYDTLARVQNRLGERDAAIASFSKSLKLDRDNLEALIGLAAALSDAGRRDAAAALLPQIDALLESRRPNLSAPLRQQLDALRALTKASL